MDIQLHTRPGFAISHAGCDVAAHRVPIEPSHIHIPRPSRVRQALALAGVSQESMPVAAEELALEEAA